MTEVTAQSIVIKRTAPHASEYSQNEYVRDWRQIAIFVTLLLINVFSQIDRILPFILAESIKADLRLSDTQMAF